MNRPDAEHVQRTLAGENRAFDQLIIKYQAAIYALTYRWTGNFTDAQDLTQECFIQAFEKLADLKEPEKFAGWLRATATNVCRMWYRNRHKPLPLDHVLEQLHTSPQPQPDTQTERHQAQQTVVDLFDLLSDKVALAARLFYVDGLSYKEIADILAVKTTTIEGRLHKARIGLRNALQAPYDHSKQKQILLKLTTLAEGIYKMDAIRIEVGAGLVELVKAKKKNNLLDTIKDLRRRLETHERFVMPPVRIVDKEHLSRFGYSIHFHETPIVEGDLSDDDAAEDSLCHHLQDAVLEHRGQFKA